MVKIGLALGGGGAKGLAHLPILNVFDELGIRPHAMAGTSIGAVVGTIWASGVPAKDLQREIRSLMISRDDSFTDVMKTKKMYKWLEFVDFEMGRGGIVKGERVLSYLCSLMKVSRFEDLPLPFRVTATDYWTSEGVVFDSVEILPAVKASMGLPGVFTPVELDGRVLIDGGAVNPVPYELLDDCDYTIAVDVTGGRIPHGKPIPWAFDAVLDTFDIMSASILAEKRRQSDADLFLAPKISGIALMDFFKADEIYDFGLEVTSTLREALVKLM
jgi:NTE family protein